MKLLNKIENILLSGIMLLTVLLTFVNVFLRQFGMGFAWTEETIRYLIIWMTFIGVSYCIRQGSHISIDAVLALLKGKSKRLMEGFIYLISLIFSFALSWFSFLFVKDQMGSTQLSPALGLPMFYFYTIIFITAILMIVRYSILLYKTGKFLVGN